MRNNGLLRSLRIRTERTVGNLGRLTTALGELGLSMGEIQTLHIGYRGTLRDYFLLFDDDLHIRQTVDKLNTIPGVEVISVVSAVEHVHRGGKLATQPTVSFASRHEIQNALGPGQLEIIELIDRQPEKARLFTTAGRTVGIFSDGANVAGLGKVRHAAMLPMLEARAALLSEFAQLNAYPFAIDVKNEEHFIETVTAVSPSLGLILLASQTAPRNQRLKDGLKRACPTHPIVDDAVDGAGISALAAFINTCKVTGKKPSQLTIGQIGLGTAGGEIARMIMAFTGRPVMGEDVHPESIERHLAAGGQVRRLEEIMAEADLVVANTNHAAVISPSLVRDGQIIMALSQPEPEITVEAALSAGAHFAIDGSAITRAVVIPGLCLGILASGATELNDSMRLAAAMALADQDHANELIPQPTDRQAHLRVAEAVANAAIMSNVCQDNNDRKMTQEDIIHFMQNTKPVTEIY